MIIVLVTEGDKAAFNELVRRYQSRVRHLLRRFSSDPTLSDDLAQQVFLQVYLKIRSLREPKHFDSWLRKICLNHWLAHCRKQDLLQHSESEFEVAADEEGKSVAHDLDAALAGLNHGERLCVVLSLQEGLSHGEISAQTELPLGTVKSHISRGQTKLKSSLNAYHPAGDSSTRDDHA